MRKKLILEKIMEESQNLTNLCEFSYSEGFNDGYLEVIKAFENIINTNGKTDDNGIEWIPLTREHLYRFRKNLKGNNN